MLKHIYFLLTTITILTISALSESSHYQVSNGYWTGTVDIDSTPLHVALILSGDRREFDCPEQKAYGIAADILYRNHDYICIDIPAVNAQAKLYVSQENGSMQGTFRQDGKTYTIHVGLNDIRKRKHP